MTRLLILFLFALPLLAPTAYAQPRIGVEITPRGPGVTVYPDGRRRDRDYELRGPRRVDGYARAQRRCERLVEIGEYRTMVGCMRDNGY